MNANTEHIRIRELQPDDSIADIAELLRAAYAPLAAMGFRFIQHVSWDETNYRSVVRSKRLIAPYRLTQ